MQCACKQLELYLNSRPGLRCMPAVLCCWESLLLCVLLGEPALFQVPPLTTLHELCFPAGGGG